MKHSDYKELLQLAVYDELGSKESELLENHLFECEECSREYEELKAFYTKVSSSQKDAPSDLVLLRARNELFEKINVENQRISGLQKIVNAVSDFLTGGVKYYAPALTTLILGFMMGYFYFFSEPVQYPVNPSGTDVDSKTAGNTEISNIRFKNPFTNDGEIEISYDAIKPITFRGSMEDDRVRELLAQALVSSDNPGFKLKTLSSMSFQDEKKFIPDQRVKSALITTVETDKNPGVRKEALNLLAKYPYDEDILGLLIYTLGNDENSGNRVTAVNLLADYIPEGISIDGQLKKKLEKQVEADNNEFIRFRASSLIKEVQ
ncbi:MAG: hypothetical protein SCALA702_18670 [Melioribacteraceae bacterium]|nr:MAG: hypothetical protein SCALA702_18670 [Melioribacteraceae bacterium]